MEPGFYGSSKFVDIIFILRSNEGYQIGKGHNKQGYYSNAWSDSFNIKVKSTPDLLDKLKQIKPKADLYLQIVNTFINSQIKRELVIENTILHIPNNFICDIIDVIYIEYSASNITLHFKNESKTILLDKKDIKKITDLYISKKSKVGYLTPRQSET